MMCNMQGDCPPGGGLGQPWSGQHDAVHSLGHWVDRSPSTVAPHISTCFVLYLLSRRHRDSVGRHGDGGVLLPGLRHWVHTETSGRAPAPLLLLELHTSLNLLSNPGAIEQVLLSDTHQ